MTNAMMKMIAGLAVLAALPFLAKAAPDFAFYFFMAVVVAIIIFVLSRKKSTTNDPNRKAGPNDQGWKLRPVGMAVKAVRSKQMTIAEASAHFGVSEKEIRALDYLDTY